MLAHESVVLIVAVGEGEGSSADGRIDACLQFLLNSQYGVLHGLINSVAVGYGQQFGGDAVVGVDSQATDVCELRAGGGESYAVAAVVDQSLIEYVVGVTVQNDINTVCGGNQPARVGYLRIIGLPPDHRRGARVRL